MTQSKHTPTPWELRQSSGNGNYFLYSENSKKTPFCGVNSLPKEGNGLSNARLIAAAPELLEALCLLVYDAKGKGITERMAIAEKAIAKARGEAS